MDGTDTKTVAVTVNGEQALLPAGTTVRQLLEDRQLRPEIVAVELNSALLRPEDYSDTSLADGDEVDYLFYMAGGATSDATVAALSGSGDWASTAASFACTPDTGRRTARPAPSPRGGTART